MNAANQKTDAEPTTHTCKDCGCADCQQECCTLDCLERPRFYCGQVLNDRDLNALTEWVREKSALSRFRHGWGVACGLGVTCGTECGSVEVSTGYAISCCGDDIIVCEPATHDFCCDIPTTSQGCEGDPKKDTEKDKDPRFSLGSYEVLKRDVFAFDLYIQYEGVLSSPQPAVSRTTCGTTSTCEHSRIRESYRLCARQVNDCETERPWEQAAKDYRSFVDTVTRPLEYKTLEDAQKRLLQLVDEWGSHRHCCLKTWICKPPAVDGPAIVGGTVVWQAWAQDIWKRLVFDRLESYFTSECFDCKEAWGVPLARVWVHRQAAGKCCVLRIAAVPPFRRRLSHDTWTAAPGMVHVGQYVGQNLDGIGCALWPRGVRLIPQEATLTQGQISNAAVFAPCFGQVTAYWYQDECGIKRVVAFRWDDGAPTPVPFVPIPINKIASIEQRYAEILTAKGVATIQQFIETPQDRIIEILGGEGVKVTKKEVAGWLAEATKLAGEK